MTDLTLLYYTANRLHECFAESVRGQLLRISGDHDIVCLSQNHPLYFGRWRSVTFAEPSIWQCYQNILAAARIARTEFVACCEDDTLYVPEHFTYRPASDVFAYNRNRWVITRRLSDDGKRRQAFYYWRERTQMAMCVCSRQLLIDTLEERFAMFPVPIGHEEAKKFGWGEPGRYERNMGLSPRTREYFDTVQPCVTFNHSNSLMGRRATQPTDTIADCLEPWGSADLLWRRIHG